MPCSPTRAVVSLFLPLLALLAMVVASAQSLESTHTARPAGQVVATGVVADENSRRAILGKLRAIYGRDNVVSEITVGQVAAPSDWTDSVQQLLVPEISSVSRGELRISGRQIHISGAMKNETERGQLVRHMSEALSEDYRVSNGLRVVAPQQARIDDRLDNRIVEFESGSARLTPRGKQLLDQLTPTLEGLQSQGIEIIGHTDNRGSRAVNNAISTARAEAVKEYLTGNGLDSASLTSLGAGEQRPIAPNDSPEGRARNRRIEFRLGRGR